MANINKLKIKPVPVDLDRPRTLVYDLNAYAELEEVYGSVNAAIESLQTGSIKAIRALLWAGLIHEEMDDKGEFTLTQAQVGKLLGLGEIEKISEAIATAIYNTMPEVDETQVNTMGQ